MAFESLSERLSATFKKLRLRGRLKESDVKDAMREVKLSLLEADVNYKVVKDFIKAVTDKSVGEDVLKSLTPAQQVIKIVDDELSALMGSEAEKINFPSKPPCIIMMCGLQGSGKTTHTGKLAKKFKSMGHRPLVVACDIYRPAAIEQLRIVSELAGVHFFEKGQISPIEIAKESLKHGKDHGFDVIILDTAGRLHVDETLMQELKDIKQAVNPTEILFVVDAMTGQDAVNVAQSFNESLEINGVILTKLDGDTRGGAALSIRAVTGKPIKFVGIGEKIDDLEEFYPDRMSSRILGMGDVLTLIEKAQNNVDDVEAERITKKFKENKFDLNDLLMQMKHIQGMGSIKQVLSMLPGISGKIKDEDIDEKQITRVEAIITSMTPYEREKPSVINHNRKVRISKGCGMKIEDVNRLLKQFEQMQKMMKKLSGSGFGKKLKGNKKMKLPR
ncbi:MAG: signal recognition particle protein [Oscillospiraceae bacterium]|nr:signal recognition particle protein [Oscillospiraceae bacterium]